MQEPIKKKLGDLSYSEIFIKEGEPSVTLGFNHDIYINTLTLEVFKKTADIWEFKGYAGDKNINPNWDETDESKKSYILNKPDFVTPEMLKNLENELNITISDLETIINQQGIIGFNYNNETNELAIIRPDNIIEAELELPIGDGLIDGFIDVNTFLQIQQHEQDMIDEINYRASVDIVNTIFDPLTNILTFKRSDETELNQKFPLLKAGNGIDIKLDQNDDLIIEVGDFELFMPVPDLDSVTDPKPHKIYLVPSDSGENNQFDEYLWINNDWEQIGGLSLNLSNYYTKSEADNLLDEKEDKILTSNDKATAITTAQNNPDRWVFYPE